jgi:hypothetical protein
MWRSGLAVALATALTAIAAPASAQSGPVDGHVVVGVDHLPNVDEATELRAGLFLEKAWTAGAWRLRGAALAEGLVADRSGTVRDGHLQIREATLGWSGGAFDLRAGIGAIVWGRLDEVQPTDVVNPLDAAKYLLRGRSEARLPVTHARVRWFAGEHATIEGVWVPLFTRGRYDVLDEASSPFNLLGDARRCEPSPACPPIAGHFRREPPRTLASSQGGARVSLTTGRVDWAVAAYSGFPGFGRVSVGPVGLPPPLPGEPPRPVGPVMIFEDYPRFTMVGGDFETVHGDWATRGELAWTTGDTIFAPDSQLGVEGRSVRAGIGADRKAGAYRLNGTLLVEHRAADAGAFSDTNVSVVAGGERGFARDTRKVQAFGAWNVSDRSGFLRTIATWSLRDNLALDGTLGWFFGRGDDAISRFSERDFLAISLKTYF